jgi:hypothetical protein
MARPPANVDIKFSSRGMTEYPITGRLLPVAHPRSFISRLNDFLSHRMD